MCEYTFIILSNICGSSIKKVQQLYCYCKYYIGQKLSVPQEQPPKLTDIQFNEKKLSWRGGVTRSTIKEGEGGISVEYTLIQEITTHRVPVYALS